MAVRLAMAFKRDHLLSVWDMMSIAKIPDSPCPDSSILTRFFQRAFLDGKGRALSDWVGQCPTRSGGIIGIHGEPNTEGSGVDCRGVVHEGTKAHRVRCGIYRRIQVAHFDPTMIDFLL